MVAGPLPPRRPHEPAELAAAVAAREAAGQPRKDAIAEVARERGVPKRDVFDAVVAAKPRPPHPARSPSRVDVRSGRTPGGLGAASSRGALLRALTSKLPRPVV